MIAGVQRGTDPRWLRQGALVFSLLLLFPLAAVGQTGGSAVPAYVTVLAGSLNVRDAPSLNGRVVGSLVRGDRLCVIRYEGDWAEIRTPVPEGATAEPRRGFVSRGFLSETRADPATLEQIGCRPLPPAEGLD